MPRTFARTGRIGDYYFVAQWFPKIGVLEDAGWNAHQFHLTTEFFADFGVYDVTLDVPQGWIVGATGLEQSRRDAGGRTAYRFVQEDVHDFAWTTSPAFVERRQRFEEPGLPPVEMRLLLQPEHDTQADRHFAAARAALKYYGTWFGPYPYPQLTIVDPVTTFNPDAQGEGTDGMEYPTLITAGTHWYNAWPDSWLEEVTIHEAGHQFWYGVVATNEFEHAWMDEGINTYATARVMQEAFPGQVRGRGALLRRTRVVGVQRRAVVARDRRRSAAVVSPGRRDGGSIAALVAVRDKCRWWNHLQQGGRMAGDTGAADRMAGDAEGAGHALPARRVPPSHARRILRHRQRGQRPRSLLVL